MSKDKKNEGKEILEEFKELSEWQKRNQEYLKKKAEEEAALAEEKEKERQARMASKSEKSDETEEQESESEPKDPESAKEESEEKVEKSEDVKKEVAKEEPKSKEPKKQNKQAKKVEKKPVKEKPAKPKIPGVHIWRAISILFLSLLLLVASAYLLSPYATMKDIRVEGTVQTTADDIRQASGIQDSDYTIKNRSSLIIGLNQLSLSINFQLSLLSRSRNTILLPTMFLVKVIIQFFPVGRWRPVL